MELLAAALRERGYVVLVTREPGGTALGEAVRELLLDPDITACRLVRRPCCTQPLGLIWWSR